MKLLGKEKLSVSWRDTGVTLLIMAVAVGVCFAIKKIGGEELNMKTIAALIFVLAVLFISRMTTGYIYGTLSSALGAFFANYVFTSPYYEFTFYVSGYPMIFLTMMAVSLITGTMTMWLQEQDKLRLETEKEKMRANLLRAISHDLRTPLTSIIGSTSAILENDGKLERKEEIRLLTEVKEEAEWLVRMVENLLSITKTNAGNAELRKNIEVVEEIVAEAVQKFKKHFPDVTVLVTVPEEPLMVPMDALLIEQVINNLLENAVLHSGSTEPVEVQIESQENQVLFHVRDHGIGIEEKDRKIILNGYFYAEDKWGNAGKKNMGLGLPVCTSIVKAHQGQIWVENAPDGGAVFSFWLPIEKEL